MEHLLIDLQYLPSVAYFSAIQKATSVTIEAHENFEKQTYRNRCRILTASKTLDLSIPVHHQGKKILITSLNIDYVQKWQNNHWRSIETAYRNAPFFDYYAEPLKEVIYSNEKSLFALNKNLLTICLKFLQIDTTIKFSKTFEKEPEASILDLRSCIHPKKDVSDLDWFKPVAYHQIFGKDFVNNLSILDLLFSEGPMASDFLRKSIELE